MSKNNPLKKPSKRAADEQFRVKTHERLTSILDVLDFLYQSADSAPNAGHSRLITDTCDEINERIEGLAGALGIEIDE